MLYSIACLCLSASSLLQEVFLMVGSIEFCNKWWYSRDEGHLTNRLHMNTPQNLSLSLKASAGISSSVSNAKDKYHNNPIADLDQTRRDKLEWLSPHVQCLISHSLSQPPLISPTVQTLTARNAVHLQQLPLWSSQTETSSSVSHAHHKPQILSTQPHWPFRGAQKILD